MKIKLQIDFTKFIVWYLSLTYNALKENKKIYSWLWLIKPDWRYYYNKYIDENYYQNSIIWKRKGSLVKDRLSLFMTNGFIYKFKKLKYETKN